MSGTTGTEEYPYPLPSEAPDGPGAFLALSRRNSDVTSPVANVAALPATGNWIGRQKIVTTTPGARWEWNGTAWIMYGIAVFADAAARTSAIASPADNMLTILKDADYIEQYLSGAWSQLGGGAAVPIIPTIVATGGTAAVDLAGKVTYSGSITALRMNSTTAILAAFSWVELVLSYNAGTAGSHSWQVAAGATINTATEYRLQGVTSAVANTPAAATSFSQGYVGSRRNRRRTLELYNLADARATSFKETLFDTDPGASLIIGQAGGEHNVASAFDGAVVNFSGLGTLSNGVARMIGHV